MEHPRPSTHRRWRWRAALSLIGLVLSALGAYGLMVVLARSEWDLEVRRARDSGMPSSLEGLAQAAVDPEENAAVLYQQVFRDLKPPGIDAERVTEAIVCAWSPERLASEDPLTAARQYLEENRSALDLLKRASKRPRCRFEVDWQAVGTVPLPHLVQVRAAAKAVRVQVAVAILEGRPHDAVTGIETVFRLSNSLVEESWLVSCLVRRSIRRMGRELARHVVQKAVPDSGDLDALDAAVSTPDPPEAWARGIDGERALLVYGQDAFCTALDSVADVRLPGQTTLSQVERRRWDRLGWTRTRDAALCLHVLTEARALVGVEYPAATRQLGALRKSVDEAPAYCWMARGNMGACESVLRDMAEDRSATCLARLAIGLERFRRARRDLPDGLSELGDAYVDQVWQDPLTGASFVYERKGQSARLSSAANDDFLAEVWTLGDPGDFDRKSR